MKRNFMSFLGVVVVIVMWLTAVTTFSAIPQSPAGGHSIYLPAVLKPENLATSRRVNVPYDTNIAIPRRSIFWFGRVDPTNNYADVRLIYDDEKLYVTLHIFDRHTWFDTTPTANTLTEWDAVSLYLDLDGNIGNAPDNNSYHFVAQLNNPPQPRTNYQVAYRGNGSGWVQASVPFDTMAGWSGVAVNNNNGDDRGWVAEFEIPFSSVGLGARPSSGTIWGLSIVLHDRDNQNGSPAITPQLWPENANRSQPATWGQLHFGLPTYTPSAVLQGSTTIQHGLNGATVTDAQVGGYFDCGEPFNPNFFDGWGDANHYNRPNRDQLNVQNQANLGDWPCFSKIYITFPLGQLPNGKEIIAAELTMNHFGNSNPSEALRSFVHVLTAGEDWTEQTITWNNAPLALENMAVIEVQPLLTFPGWPGIPRVWDVSRAVADAYEANRPLRLILYSTDGAMHSGKYFYSSDADLEGRPMLVITWGE
jgi:hypothetical protein